LSEKKVEEKKPENTPNVSALELPPVKAEAEKVEVAKPAKHFEALDQLLVNLEAEYRKTKAKIVEDLHNELAEVIVKHVNERQATIDTILVVLEILRHEMVTQKIQQLEKGIPVEKVL
jgi:septum formation topological specificity factor MinE